MVNTTTKKQPNAAESRRYDKNEVKTAARGRWGELLNLFASIPADYLDGRHHDCPLCGQGTDRFRALDDFDETGAVFCNRCHDRKNGDGFAAIAKATGKPFPEVLADVGEYLGVQPRPSKNGDARRNGQKWKDTKKRRDPLAEVSWFDEQVAKVCSPWLDGWCQKKPPVTPRAAEAFGGRLCRWPKTNGHLCIGFTGRDMDGTPKAVLAYRVDGQPFPATKNLSERKTHLVAGSTESWLFPGDQFPTAASVFHKCEGLPDALTLASAGLPDDHVAMTNACGAKSHRKLDYSWAKSKGIVIAADADLPGVEGGKLHAARAHQAGAAWVKLITPPGYEIADDGGRDFRDWFAEGHTMDEYLALVDAAPAITAEEAKDWGATRKGDKKNDGAITNAIEIPGDDGKNVLIPLTMTEILERINAATDGWPRRVGNSLFVDDRDHGGVCWLDSQAALFGCLASNHGVIEWHRMRGCVGREEAFAELERTATQYQAIEVLPHEPLVEGHYYSCDIPETGDGTTVERLLDFFSPESDIDRSLLLAAFLTPLWGGPTGRRPAFLFTAKEGRGVGKSTAVQILASVYGGAIDFSLQTSADDIKKRLLSKEGLCKRVAMLDNLKTLKFSSAELESLITADQISGHRLYAGEGSRPNLITWLITLNGASLSADMAGRIVEVRFSRPTYTGNWEADVRGFIEENRDNLIADMIGWLRKEPQNIGLHSRWASWEQGVLARLPRPVECFRTIAERREEVDADQEEGGLIEDAFRGKVRWLGYDPERTDVFIPTNICAKWYNQATGEAKKATGVSTSLRQLYDEGKMTRLLYYRRGGSGERGFRWVGERVGSDEPTQFDLAVRLAKKMSEQQSSKDGEYGEADL
jgi:hypothetical protein